MDMLGHGVCLLKLLAAQWICWIQTDRHGLQRGNFCPTPQSAENLVRQNFDALKPCLSVCLTENRLLTCDLGGHQR